MIGQHEAKGTIIRFKKRDGALIQAISFEDMSCINSVAHAKTGDDIFLCGDY